jgi:hypothetical protein
MSSDDLYKNIGFVVVVIVFAYIVHRVIKFQNNVVEGMRTKEDIDKDKEAANTLKENKAERDDNMKEVREDMKTQEKNYRSYMDLKKNKKLYDDVLVSQYNNLNYVITNMVLGNSQAITTNPSSTESIGLMVTTNAMREYVKTIEFVSDFLDTTVKAK